MLIDEYTYATPGRFERIVERVVNATFALFIFLTRA